MELGVCVSGVHAQERGLGLKEFTYATASPKSAVHIGRLEMPADDVVMLTLKVDWR